MIVPPPSYYVPETGEWEPYPYKVGPAHRRNPCALCGWAKHMGIHCVQSGTKPAGSFGLHSYVPADKQQGEPT